MTNETLKNTNKLHTEIPANSDYYDELGIITMDDIRNYTPDPNLCLVGDGHISRGKDRIHLIAGYTGVGKSRAASYLAYCGATGQKWFDYEVKNKFKTLYLQNENGMARLKNDFDEYSENLKDWVTFSAPKGGLNFENSALKTQLQYFITENHIDMLIIDTFLTQKLSIKLLNNIVNCLPDDPYVCPAVMIVTQSSKPSGFTRNEKGIELRSMIAPRILSRSNFILALEYANYEDYCNKIITVASANTNNIYDTQSNRYTYNKIIFNPTEGL